MTDLLSILKSLSPTDDSVWTDDGLPSLDAVSVLVGSKVTRVMINKVALGLTRINVTTFEPVVDANTPVVESQVVEDTTDYVAKAAALEAEAEAKVKAANEAAEAALKAQQDLRDAQSKIKEPDPSITLEQTMIAHQAYLKQQEDYRQSKIAAFEAAGLTLDDLYIVFPQLRGSLTR